MKRRLHDHTILKKAAVIPAAAALGLLFGMPAMAAPDGHLDWANQQTITGWAWDSDTPDQALEVHIDITPAGSDRIAKTLTVTAESYRGDLTTQIGSGNHGFFCPVDWTEFSGSEFTVTAYVTTGSEIYRLTGTIPYDTASESPVLSVETESRTSKLTPVAYGPGSAGPNGASGDSSGQTVDTSAPGSQTAAEGTGEKESAGPGTDPENAADDPAPPDSAPGPAGPGAAGPGSLNPDSGHSDTDIPADEEAGTVSSESGWKQGVSLGIFSTTGYCNCPSCSKWGLTYSGTVPQANHTIAADITILPIGTKVMINGIVYTVEDIGSGVKGNHIDIYYGTHEGAVNHGWQQAEVFSVIAE